MSSDRAGAARDGRAVDDGPGSIEFLSGPLPQATIDALADEVAVLAARARGWETDDELARFREHYKIGPLRSADLIALARGDGGLIGACSFRFLRAGPRAVLHLSNAALMPSAQRLGMMERMVRGALQRSPDRPHRYLTTITQSSVVYATLARHGTMHPQLDGAPAPEPAPTLARFIAATFNPGLPFDEATSVLREECQFRYRHVPRHGDAAVNALFDTRLRYEHGDVLVTVLELSETTAVAASRAT